MFRSLYLRNCHFFLLQAEREKTRVRQIRRRLDEMEEELIREQTKARNLQRMIDDLNAANDTLSRDNTSLRGQRRPVRDTLLGGRRVHIRNSSPHDDLDSIGTEGNRYDD
ncbi:unnamed protein product [Onchocerca flexuosa]|uniref:Myosin_tail_1 domain-containing protein n=1 Tax=Onchocerca flexuosa TaxID=387005 RepID=A0A183HX42_9BILA|nr:unnamed protein product [Onchocerca flexuosa]